MSSLILKVLNETYTFRFFHQFKTIVTADRHDRYSVLHNIMRLMQQILIEDIKEL